MTGLQHRRSISRNRNKRLSTDLLPLIKMWLDQLHQSPKNDYLKEVIFSKYSDAKTVSPALRRERAIEKWHSVELVNAETNERLLSTPSDAVLLPGVRFSAFVDWVRDFISLIIGDTIPEEVLFGSFSGGASTSRKRTESHPALKFVGKAHSTKCAMDIFESIDTKPLWESYGLPELIEVPGAEMFTVPKSTDIDRVACKEPDINMYLQKGVGLYFRRRLRRMNINLNDQSVNRSLAQLGSAHGHLATLDLSSASDSVTRSLVEILLPDQWFSYLNQIRSQKILIGDSWYTCEMFSSMGNGFTFELESLLFFALAKATAYFTGTKGRISIYGDDIIVPCLMAQDLRHILFYFGFSLNDKKSFWEGPFRESCGGHYHNGEDITPFFIRKPIVRLNDLLLVLNNIRIWASRGESSYLAEDAWPIWDLLSEEVPRSLKGGDIHSSGDSQLISPDWPRKRLVPVFKKLDIGDVPLYLHHMMNQQDAQTPSEESFAPMVVEVGRRYTSVQRWDWHSFGLYFLSEVTDEATKACNLSGGSG